MNEMIKASQEIARILRDLEKKTGCLVDTISISNIGVTNMSDDGQRFLRSVVITMKREPGMEWNV